MSPVELQKLTLNNEPVGEFPAGSRSRGIRNPPGTNGSAKPSFSHRTRSRDPSLSYALDGVRLAAVDFQASEVEAHIPFPELGAVLAKLDQSIELSKPTYHLNEQRWEWLIITHGTATLHL